MLFSSLVFLYVFLPITLVGYYILPKQVKNVFLLLASLVFFAWGGVSYSSILIFSITFNYIVGRLINKFDSGKGWLIVGIIVNLLFLFVFKYVNFIIDNINEFFIWISVPKISNPSIILPIGISFYTFQAISYLIDVYRKTCSVQKNYISLGLYISFFPQLIAGPIVRYYDIQKQIFSREHNIEKFASGVQRFILGFAKKVIIANSMGYVADEVFALQPLSNSTPIAWIGIIAYSLQIYYDFAGYSDMAIGLARMFGFELLENFNFPYVSCSIKEFWRRWHISLSNWFRDYLYIPLGGNRFGANRTLINLSIVFFVTGFWHGASWNFVIWGLVHGLFLIIERAKFGTILEKIPKAIQIAYTLFVVVMAWVLFRADNLSNAIQYYQVLFGFSVSQTDSFMLSKIVTRESVTIFIIAIMGAFGIFIKIKDIALHILNKIGFIHTDIIKTIAVTVFILFVLLYGTGSLVLNSYNPFIYFRF